LKLRNTKKAYLYAILIVAILVVWGYVFYKKSDSGEKSMTGQRFGVSMPTTQIWAKNQLINTGRQKLNTPVSATFELKNTGVFPLTIYDVATDCNCTVSEWKKAPILPNEVFHIKLTYSGKMLGFFQKKGIVKCNIPNGTLVIVMRGEMEM
jgi:Protein of unknown function (DUF1573)